MVRTLADCRADMAHIQHGCKADINVHRDHFAGHQPPGVLSQFAALFQTMQRSKGLSRRQAGKALTKTLYASAFLIYRHHQMVT